MALRNQLMLGGHLGTCLLELGLLSEEALGQTLADVHGVPYAGEDSFTWSVAPSLNTFSRRVVEEFRAIPVKRGSKAIRVAMVDPRDLTALDALTFASGLQIERMVVPEFRFFEALEKFYGVPRRPRFVALSAAIALRKTGATHPRKSQTNPRTGGDGHGDTPAGSVSGVEFGYGQSWLEIAKTLVPNDPLFHAAAADEAPPPAVRDRFTDRLCAANNRDDVAFAALDELGTTLARAGLFAVRGDELVLWAARGLDPVHANRAPFPIGSNGILKLVLGDDHYRGPVGNDPENHSFYEWLGIDPPAEILLIPVHLNDRFVALLYGDGGTLGRVQGQTEGYVRLTRMLAAALGSLVYKNKIRATGSFAGAVRA
jgi:hypothetical protein